MYLTSRYAPPMTSSFLAANPIFSSFAAMPALLRVAAFFVRKKIPLPGI